MDNKYIKIKLHGGNSYIESMKNICNALDGELDGVEFGDTITLDFTPINITDEEYEKLPEFTGH